MSRDWRARCILLCSLHLLSDCFETEIATVVAQLLHSGLSYKENCGKFYSVPAAFVLKCPFQKSFVSKLFSFTKYLMKLFTADLIFSLLLQDQKKS